MGTLRSADAVRNQQGTSAPLVIAVATPRPIRGRQVLLIDAEGAHPRTARCVAGRRVQGRMPRQGAPEFGGGRADISLARPAGRDLSSARPPVVT